jgi:molybdopterin converting factor small subunit
MIKVRLKVFGPLRDILPESVLELPASLSGDALYSQLSSRHPELAKWRSSVRLAVNCEYVDFARMLNDNDEVGLIPPVSGG